MYMLIKDLPRSGVNVSANKGLRFRLWRQGAFRRSPAALKEVVLELVELPLRVASFDLDFGGVSVNSGPRRFRFPLRFLRALCVSALRAFAFFQHQKLHYNALSYQIIVSTCIIMHFFVTFLPNFSFTSLQIKDLPGTAVYSAEI